MCHAPSAGRFNAVLRVHDPRLNAALNAGGFPADACCPAMRRKTMNRRIVVALIGASALVGATGVLIAMAPPRGTVFIAGDQPVSEAQVREKLQSDGYSNILVLRRGRVIE